MEGLVKSAKRPFNPQAFLAKVGTGKTIQKYRKNRIIYAQKPIMFFTSNRERSR